MLFPQVCTKAWQFIYCCSKTSRLNLMKLRHVPHLSRSPGIGPVEYVPLAAEHARCFLERFFADEEGIVFFNTNLPPLVVFFFCFVFTHTVDLP